MSTISCPTPLQIHHLNFQSLQITAFSTIVIYEQNSLRFRPKFCAHFHIEMTTYEAGTKLPIHIKKEKPDDSVPQCVVEGKYEKNTEKQTENETVKIPLKRQMKENNEESRRKKSKTEKKCEDEKVEEQEQQNVSNFAHTNKFSIFNLLNTKHHRPRPSATVSSAPWNTGARPGPSAPAAPNAAAGSASLRSPGTSRELSEGAPTFQLKRSPSLHLLESDTGDEDGTFC